MRFDFLNDAPPHALERLRGARVPAHLHVPLSAVLTAILVVGAWATLERHWVGVAMRQDAIATERLNDARAAWKATALARTDVDRLLALDRRLREVRLSGSKLAARFAAIANRLPEGAWLTSLSRDANGVQIDGRARTIVPVAAAIAELRAQRPSRPPLLLRVVRDPHARANIVDFALQVPERAP